MEGEKKYIASDGTQFDTEEAMLQHNKELEQKKQEKKEEETVQVANCGESNDKSTNENEETFNELFKSGKTHAVPVNGNIEVPEGKIAVIMSKTGKVIGIADSNGNLTLPADADEKDIEPLIKKNFRVNGNKLNVNRKKRLEIDSDTIKGMKPADFKKYYKKNILGIDENSREQEENSFSMIGNGKDSIKPTNIPGRQSEGKNLGRF